MSNKSFYVDNVQVSPLEWVELTLDHCEKT